MKENIKLVEETHKQSKESAYKVTPSFDQLTPTGIKMLKNMGDIEVAKLYMKDLFMEFGGDNDQLGFMIVLLEAINKKIEAMDDPESHDDHPSDFIRDLQTRLFNCSVEHGNCLGAYISALTSGNFIVENIITPKSENEPEPESTPLKAVA